MQVLVPAPQPAEEQVLAMDDSDTDSEPIQQIQLPIPEVEIAPFPDFNNLQVFMPEEIQEDDLMGEEEIQEWLNANGANANGSPRVNDNGNIQVGLVQIQNSWPQKDFFSPASFNASFDFGLNSGLDLGQCSMQSLTVNFDQGQCSKQSLPVNPFDFDSSTWMHPSQFSYTCPSPTTLRMWSKFFSPADSSMPTMSIPANWMDFFTMMLLKDSSFA